MSWDRKSPDLRCSARSRGTRSCFSRAWNCRAGSRLQLGTTWLGELLGVLARQQPGGKGSLRGNVDDQSAQYLGLGPVPLRSADLARILRSLAPQAPVVRHPASSTASLSTAEALRPTLTPAASPASELKPRHPLGPLKSMATDHADESERCVERPLGRAGEQTSGGHRLDQCGPRQWIAEFLPRPRCGLPVGNHGRPVLWRAPLRRGSLPARRGMRGRVRWSRGGPLLRGRRRRRTARPVPSVRAAPARPADRAAAVRSSPPTTPTLPRTACLRGSAAYGAGDQSSRPALPGHLHRVREEAARPRTPPNSPTTACLASPDWRGCGPSVRPGPESSASQEALLATGQ